MKRYIPLLVATLLAGCAASSPVGQAVTKTVTFTVADLQNAAAISKAAGDVDHGVECFTWMAAEMPAIQAALAPTAPASVTGVFSALEQANIATNTVSAGIPPALKLAAEVNCGPYVMNLAGGINYLLIKAGQGTVVGGAAAILP